MVTALVWHDAKSFKRHLEQMRRFRLSHRSDPEGRFMRLKDMPTPFYTRPPGETGGARGTVSVRSMSVVIPMWEIVLSRNLQN
jgi:hypothetical protein